jgi:hypothetical protein
VRVVLEDLDILHVIPFPCRDASHIPGGLRLIAPLTENLPTGRY